MLDVSKTMFLYKNLELIPRYGHDLNMVTTPRVNNYLTVSSSSEQNKLRMIWIYINVIVDLF